MLVFEVLTFLQFAAAAMPARLPSYVLWQLRQLLDETELSPRAIANMLGIHYTTVLDRIKCLELYGELYSPSLVVKGRPRKLTPYQEEVYYPSAHRSTQ